MKKSIFFILMGLLFLQFVNAANPVISLTNSEKQKTIEAGSRIKVYIKTGEKLRGKLSFCESDTVQLLIVGKDTVSPDILTKIKVYNKVCRVSGNVVTGIGSASTLLGVIMLISSATQLGEPGSWADLAMIIGGIYTFGSAGIAGVGTLVASIGPAYDLNEWNFKIIEK